MGIPGAIIGSMLIGAFARSKGIGKDYVPYITDKSKKGLNFAVMMIGIILAAVFAASTAYSGMKSGLTVAAGIPGAIIGSMLIGAFARSKGILGKNIIQGMSSGGESIASGIIYNICNDTKYEVNKY